MVYEELKSDFRKLILSIDYSKNLPEKWADLIFMIAASLKNSIKNLNPNFYCQKIEDEYLKIIQKYEKKDQKKFPEILALFVEMADKTTPKDILGEIFMDLNLSDSWKGQFFTPNSVSEMMADIQLNGFEDKLKTNNFLTINDPACGAGSTLLACVHKCIKTSYNPAKSLLVYGQDIDRTAALMCYIQLALWNVPALISVGDTLKNEVRELWHTPSYVINSWRFKENKKPIDTKNFILIGEPY